LRAPRVKSERRAAPSTLSARLIGHVTLEAAASGELLVSFDGISESLGEFRASTVQRALNLRAGLPLNSFASYRRNVDKEIHLLVRQLAKRGLLEYRLGSSRHRGDEVVIEPQIPDYWPRQPRLRDTDALVLSRFAYMRRRADQLVLESPRAGALFKICNPKIATTLATLAVPQRIKQLRRRNGFPGVALLALLVDCQILFKVDAAKDKGLRATEGDDNFVLWDFHDLLFHTRSTEGRHANPAGGLYPYVGSIAPQPATRRRWPGEKIDLPGFSTAHSEDISPGAMLLRKRHSTRDFDERNPITLDELSRFLDDTARVRSTLQAPLDPDSGSNAGNPVLTYTVRPYPSAGASYELELYLAVDKCQGLTRGFYHYDAAEHALVSIGVRKSEFEALLKAAEFAMDAPAVPQILITITARFGRISWKYGSIAYALILKDVGVLMQTFCLMAADMGLGGCAIGSTNIELFAKLTGLEFHVEGAVGQFALGRGAEPAASE
jgi:SagB-type dehydrogenase family enzyme